MARGYRFGIFLVIVALLLSPAAAFGAPAEQGDTSYYVVQPGDTLADIAYKLGVSAATLAKANGITNWDFIYVGQTLLIPGLGGAPTPEPPPASPTPPPATPTPAPAATPTEAATVVPSATQAPPATVVPPATLAGGATVVYTVVPGDTLNKIAARHGTSVKAIMASNGLTNPDFIWVGQRLTLGGSANPPQPTPALRAAPAAATPQPRRAVPALQPPQSSQAGKWIDVNLSEQRLIAYEGKTPVLNVLISGGTAVHPTVVGEFAVNSKVRSQTMSGVGYSLPNVPWVMYFYRDYAIHGTYWHNNFGHPMSHGCVNVTIADAAWLYTWATIGTPVVTHW